MWHSVKSISGNARKMKNDNGTQLNILGQYLGERTAKCNGVLHRKGDILVMK